MAWMNWQPFCRQHFEMHFLQEKFLYFDSNFAEVCIWLLTLSQHWFRLTAPMLTKFFDTKWHHLERVSQLNTHLVSWDDKFLRSTFDEIIDWYEKEVLAWAPQIKASVLVFYVVWYTSWELVKYMHKLNVTCCCRIMTLHITGALSKGSIWLSVDNLHKGQVMLRFEDFILLAWISFWTKSQEAGEMRCINTHVALTYLP